jgi:hypothetical protein
MVKRKMGVVLFVSVFAAAALLSAADRDKPAAASATVSATKPAPAAKPAPTAGGLVVFKDAVTGEVRPPQPGEVRALLQKAPVSRALLRRSQAVSGPQVSPRGVRMPLPESTMVSLVVTKAPDGKLSGACVSGGQKAAQARLAAGAPMSTATRTKEASNVQ